MSNFILSSLLKASANSVINGLDMAMGDAEKIIWTVLSKYVSSIGALIMLAAIIFTLLRGGLKMEDMHAQWTTHSLKLITLLVITVLLGSFSFWGWMMLGK